VLTLHPHGPASIESSIVNLAQDYSFTNNFPLIEKKGYFGERMETTPAAGRYIECKLSELANFLLFDDMNQVEMIPNFDERATEPLALLPKLPLMLLNGSEGIGTGFSSVIPSFSYKDIIDSMLNVIETERAKKISPYFAHYAKQYDIGKDGQYIFPLRIEQINDKIIITEIPRNFDAVRIYNHLNKFIENGYLKDFIDSSINNDIHIELLFKKGQTPPLEEIRKKFYTSTSLVPNYTLISERGVKIFNNPQEIIYHFTQERLKVVKRRYELLSINATNRMTQNKEIITFIQKKFYHKATKVKNRKEYIDFLTTKKFKYAEYLADMPIYRMTKDEVGKRKDIIKEDLANIKEYKKIVSSDRLIRKKLVQELEEVRERLQQFKNIKTKKSDK
jgi:DNA gyrase subunit A